MYWEADDDDLHVTKINNVTVGNSPKFTDTTYTFAGGTNSFTVTPSGGSAQTITVTPSITNNVTGSGTSGYLAKFNGANTITNGPALGSDTTKYLRNDGSWVVPTDSTKVAKAGDTMTGALNLVWASDATMTYASANPQINFCSSSATDQHVKLVYTASDSYRAPYGLKVIGEGTSTANYGAWFETEGKFYSKGLNMLVTGTGTAAQDKGSGVSPRYFPAKWTFNLGANPANGDMLFIKIPVAGSDYGVFVSTDNGTTYYPVAVTDTGRLGTHFAVNRAIALMFDSSGQVNSVYAVAGANSRSNVTGGCWRLVTAYVDGNTYDRNRFNVSIKISSAVDCKNANIIVGKDGVYTHLKQGTPFDITYPILYLNEDKAKNGTTTNTYDCINFTITTTQSITLTQYLPVYIKGTLSGTIFTPFSTTPLTQTVPTSEDGYTYIELGIASSTTSVYLEHRHRIFAYKHNAFSEIVRNATFAGLLKPVSSTTVTGFTDWNIPSGSYQVWGQRFSDSRLKYTPSGGSETEITDTGDWTMWLTGNSTTNTATLNMRIDGTFYASGGFNGNLSGNASTATKATQDSDGNAINTTYLKKSGGTITGALALNGDLQLKPASSSSNDSPDIVWYYGNGQEKARLWTADTYSAASGLTYRLYKSDGTLLHSSTIPLSDTKNTAGSTDTSSKIFLIGATSQAANPQTYSDDQVYVTSGTLQTNKTNAAAGVYANTASNGAAGGVSLYGTSEPHAYGITMRNTGTSTGQLGKHGYVQGDWAGYLCFDGATNRGWVFRQAGNNIASVSGLGHAVFNGSVTVGGNTANTSGCRMEFNSTNKCIDFVFA